MANAARLRIEDQRFSSIESDATPVASPFEMTERVAGKFATERSMTLEPAAQASYPNPSGSMYPVTEVVLSARENGGYFKVGLKDNLGNLRVELEFGGAISEANASGIMLVLRGLQVVWTYVPTGSFGVHNVIINNTGADDLEVNHFRIGQEE